MPHQFLHYLDVRALLQQVRGKGMAQQVRINPFRDARLPRGSLQPFRHDAFRKGFARPTLEEPHFRLIQPIVFRQLLHQRPRQQRVAVFPALALPHPYQVAGLVDVAGLQFQQFADAQAGGVEDGEDAEEAQVFRRHVKYPLDFILAQHVGQGLLALGTVHPVTPPFLPEHFLVVELDGIDALVLLARGYVPLVDEMQQVAVYLVGRDGLYIPPLEMLLEIPEVSGIYPYRVVAVAHLPEFLQIAFGKRRTTVLLFFPARVSFYGGIVDECHLHIAVEELRKHEALFGQISFAADKLRAFLLRQGQAQAVVVEGYLNELPAVPDGRRKPDSGFCSLCFHVLINSYVVHFAVKQFYMAVVGKAPCFQCPSFYFPLRFVVWLAPCGDDHFSRHAGIDLAESD